MASSRPFKLVYKVGSTYRDESTVLVSHAASPEGILRAATVRLYSGQADRVEITLDGDPFATLRMDGMTMEMDMS
jgi:hypothetical protein